MIYSKAVSWKPMDVSQLREYVDRERKAHYVDGDMSEYIMPNWDLYSRESRRYVDVETHNYDVRGWSVPRGYSTAHPSLEPCVLRLGDAFSALGMFSPKGLRAVAETWEQLTFADEQHLGDSHRLTQALLQQLIRKGSIRTTLTKNTSTQSTTGGNSQCFDFDFSLVSVPLEDLKREQDAIFYAEAGGY